MIHCFILLLYAYTIAGIGYDAGGGDRKTCGRPYRAGRLYQPPCDLGRMGYCSQAGQLYPWKAVKRFVKDNQGLMRRMYGDQRHGHVLKSELDDIDFEEEWEKKERENGGYGRWKPKFERYARFQHHDDIDNDLDEDLDLDIDNGEPRYLRGDLTNEDVLNTKFVISEQEEAIAIKLTELKAAAHFRPATHKSPFKTTKPQSSTSRDPETTSTLKSSTTTPHKATSTAEPKNGATTAKTKTGNEESSTTKWEITKETTKSSSSDGTEGSTLTTTPSPTTDFIDLSTTVTTTDRATEGIVTTTENSNHNGTQTSENATATKSSADNESANDRVGEIGENEDTISIEKLDSGESLSENSKNSDLLGDEHFDQTVESSENSEVYSDSDGNVEDNLNGKPPTVLFQDMEEHTTKKRVPVDFNKMKGVNACPVKEEVVAPFWANNTRGEVLALLNMYPFEQYVHWEKCTFEHRQMYCREGCRCEQQYRLHRLLAYDPSNECRGIFSDWFRFPSCCVCKCYDMPPEFRVTSRSPRFQVSFAQNDEDYDT